MNDLDPERLQAFVDGELDLAGRLAVESRIAEDPGVRRRVDELVQLRETLREHADYHLAPEALRASLSPRMADDASAVPRPRTRGRSWTTAWRPVAFAFALVVAVGIGWSLRRDGDDALAEQVVASHVRSTIGDRLVDVASSDHHVVKPWLSARLDYSPPVRDRDIDGATFVGARVDYLDGRPVAALVYRKGGHVVDAYVWPTTARDGEVASASRRGFRMAHWSASGMTHWVVSDIDPVELASFVRSLRAADTGP